jgi:hypothetical protein
LQVPVADIAGITGVDLGSLPAEEAPQEMNVRAGDLARADLGHRCGAQRDHQLIRPSIRGSTACLDRYEDST